MQKKNNCKNNLENCKGKCCTFFRIEMDLTEDTKRYFELHGIRIIDNKILHFDIPCKMFDPETKTCSIYETRPELCKLYPREFDPIPDGCIYHKKKSQKGLISKILKKIFKGDNMVKKKDKNPSLEGGTWNLFLETL